MKSASIRTVKHGLAGMIAEVEQGEEIIITRRNRPIARLAATPAATNPAPPSAATLRTHWKRRPSPPAVRSTVTHAALVAAGRGDV